MVEVDVLRHGRIDYWVVVVVAFEQLGVVVYL